MALGLKNWRERRGMTQQELAEAVGVHVQYISAIECGRRRPGMQLALRIRDYSKNELGLDDLLPAGGKVERDAA